MVLTHAALFLNEYLQQVNVLSFSNLSFQFKQQKIVFEPSW